MIVWGGDDASGPADTGGQYNPVGDVWLPTSTTSVPVARDTHTAVWTGTSMIVWGGLDSNPGPLNSGGLLSIDPTLDRDGDGFPACLGDCDDGNPTVYPGAPELCDGIDNNCDGLVDEGTDVDADGVTSVCDNCPTIYNPGQENADGTGPGDACQLTITFPLLATDVDCAGPPPTITWSQDFADGLNQYKVFIAWDAGFASTKRVTSGSTLLKKTSFLVPATKWTTVCKNASPDLFLKIFGKNSSNGKSFFSSVVTLKVK
jgi:hypothetical protein